MAIADYKQYMAEKREFFSNHGYDFEVSTSPMDQYGVYNKEFVFSDGAVWYERLAPTWRKAGATVEVITGVTVRLEQDVKLFETEYWSTDNAESRKYYEKF